MQLSFLNICFKCRSAFLTVKFRVAQGITPMSTTSSDTSQENMEVLQELGFEEYQLKSVYGKVSTKQPARLKLVVEKLQDLGFTLKKIKNHYTILKSKPKIIDNRFNVLKEVGFYKTKITINAISMFSSLMMRTVLDLKVHGFIDKHMNVTQNILRHSDFPPDMCPTEEDESDQLSSVQITAIKTYLCWKFDLPKERVDILYVGKPERSLKLIMQSYKVLSENVELSDDQLKNNIYLLKHHADDYLDILERLPMVGPVPLRLFAKTNPKILLRPADQLIERLETMKDLGLPIETIPMNPDIMLLSSPTIRKRLQFLQEDTELRTYGTGPRVIKAIITFRKCRRRQKLLKDINWRCQSLDLLATGSKYFQERLKAGNDFSMGTDIIYYLKKELKMNSAVAVRAALKQNHVWYKATQCTVTTNLEVLRGKGFTDLQISNAITVLLYPTPEVVKCLEEMDSWPEVDCCRDPNTKQLKTDLVLHLVLYYLERPYHFNGNGLFKNQPALNHDLISGLSLDNTCETTK